MQAKPASTREGMLPAWPRFSLSRGGPLFRVLRAARIVRLQRGDTLRTSAAVIGLTWVPTMAFFGAEYLRSGEVDALFGSFAVHSRFLVAVPSFFLAEAVLELHCSRALARFWECRLAPDVDQITFSAVTRPAEVVRDSWLFELLLLMAALLSGQSASHETPGPTGVFRILSEADSLSVARVWYGVVALTIFRFLLLRVLARWGLWCFILYRLSRLDIRPVATHPDGSGGLGFLSEPALGAAFIAFGLSAGIAGVWGTQVERQGAAPESFYPLFGVLAVVVVAVTFAPLGLFARHLRRARLQFLRQYSFLAFAYTRQFHRRWIEGTIDDTLLGSSDIQSLADLGHSYQSLSRMRRVPVNQRTIALVIAALATPMLPVFAAKLSLAEIAVKLARAALGGLPP